MSYFDDVKRFHEVFRLPVGQVPHIPFEEEQHLRLRLIREEYNELRRAHDQGNLVGVADALADLTYVICGMAVSYGIPLNEIWEEVHKTNMAKLDWPDGIRRGPRYRKDGKVLKPEGWQPPNIERILREALARPDGESV